MTRRLWCSGITAVLLGMMALPSDALAAEPRVFFKFQFSWGPSVDPSHDMGWFDALSVSDGLAVPGSIPTQDSPERLPAFSDIQITRVVDRGSIELRRAAMELPYTGQLEIEMTQPADTSKPILRMEADVGAAIISVALAAPSLLQGSGGAIEKEIITLRLIPHGFIRWISYVYGPSNELISTIVETAGQFIYGGFNFQVPSSLIPGVPSTALSGGPGVSFRINGVEHSASSFFECANTEFVMEEGIGFHFGARTFSPFQITKAIGIDSAYLRKQVISKTTFATVAIEVTVPSVTKYRVTLTNFRISSVGMAAPVTSGASIFDTPAVGATTEVVTFEPSGPGSVHWEFWTYDAMGQPSTYDEYLYTLDGTQGMDAPPSSNRSDSLKPAAKTSPRIDGRGNAGH